MPASVVWEKPGRQATRRSRMQKDYRVVPRGVAARHRLQHLPDVERLPGPVRLAGHRQPGHRQAAPAGGASAGHLGRGMPRGAAEAGFDPTWCSWPPRPTARGWPRRSPSAPEVAIIDYTGGPAFGGVAGGDGAARGQLVYTEKAGVNTVVVDSTDNLRGALGNLAFSLTLYSRPDVHDPAERLRPARRHRHRRGPPVVRGVRRRGWLRRSAGSPATTPAPSSCSAPR